MSIGGQLPMLREESPVLYAQTIDDFFHHTLQWDDAQVAAALANAYPGLSLGRRFGVVETLSTLAGAQLPVLIERRQAELQEGYGTSRDYAVLAGMQLLAGQPAAATATYQAAQAKADDQDLLNSYFADAYFSVARTLTESGATEQAASYYRQFLALAPNLSDKHQKIIAALQLGRDQISDPALLSKILDAYQQRIADEPADPQHYLQLAEVLTAAGRPQEVLPVMQLAVERLPDLPELWFQMGTSLEQQSRRREAADAYLHALEIDPDHTRALLRIGNLFAQTGDAAILQRLEQQFALRPPSNAAQYIEYARLLMRQATAAQQ
jgi:tetratricopeptide (TPR) repeat protein